MLRKIFRGALIVLAVALAILVVQAIRYRDTIQRVFLGGLHVHETVPPAIPQNLPRPAILVFSKTNAFRHEEAIPPANALFARIARENGWGVFQTENGAAFTPAILARFDAVVFNNVSGDVFSADQQAAFKAFVESGGGYVGVHAAGDNSHKDWGWYTNSVIGADFTMHTMDPQFQLAKVTLENPAHPLAAGLPATWNRTEEWYSFEKSPRSKGFDVLLTIDETSYNPVGMFGKDLRMGADHPVAWYHCSGRGRVFYTAFGHRAEAFAEPETVRMLGNALTWATRRSGSDCDTAPATPASGAPR